jgi:signal transduction histidine kinase
MDNPILSLRGPISRSALKPSVPKLSTCVMVLFLLATITPWFAYAWVAVTSRDEQLASAGERLQLLASAYAGQIVETAHRDGPDASSQMPPVRMPANLLRNMPDVSGVEFTTRPARGHGTGDTANSANLNPAQLHHRDGKIIAEVEIPAPSVVASASERESAALAPWSRRSWFTFTLLMLRTIITTGVGVFLFCQIRWREAAQAELIRTREAAESATRAKSEFLAHMSHELRTPLNAVIGFSEAIKLAMFGPLDSRYSEYGGHILASGKHLLQLVNDVLDLSKLEAGRFELQESELNIETVVRSATRLVTRQAEKTGVRIYVNVAPGIPFILGDSRRLQQAILNLISNAIKFTRRNGEVRISVFENDCGLAIKVADTGIGIPADQIATAMQPFRQVKRLGSEVTNGTGLGLPIARDLVALHGGTLTLASRVNAGTIATIQLPAGRLLRNVA